MTSARRVLLLGGIALALLGMAYGWWYAAFAEHQTLDRIGSSLSAGFSNAAAGDRRSSQVSLQQYREAKYIYDRQVDVHGHWIGLAMLLILLGIGFDRLSFPKRWERWKLILALCLLIGAFLFPLGVLLQTYSHGDVPRAVAIIGSIFVIASLSAIATGFAGNPRKQ